MNNFPPTGKKTCVIHIRRGDNVEFLISSGKRLILHGNNMQLALNDNSSNVEGDSNRSMVPIDKYLAFLRLLKDNNIDNRFDIVVITDGFLRSKSLLIDFLAENEELTNIERGNIIRLLETDLERQLIQDHFNSFPIRYILGESYKNLKRSISELALANVLIFGNGGFAFFIHGMYSHDLTSSHVYHVSEFEKFKDELLII